MAETIVVTRHPALVQYLRESGLITEDDKVIEHATVDDVRGKRVIGVLPLHLAAAAEEVIVVPLDLPAELRGQELTVAQVRQYAGPATTYVVRHRRWAYHEPGSSCIAQQAQAVVPTAVSYRFLGEVWCRTWAEVAQLKEKFGWDFHKVEGRLSLDEEAEAHRKSQDYVLVKKPAERVSIAGRMNQFPGNFDR